MLSFADELEADESELFLVLEAQVNGWQSMECSSLPCQCIQPGLHHPGTKDAKSPDAMLHLALFRVCSAVPVSQGEAPSSSAPPWEGEFLPSLASAGGFIAVFSIGVLLCEPQGSAPEGTLIFCLGAAQWEMPQVQLPVL